MAKENVMNSVENFADEAIAKMRPPHKMHIICIDITNKCDLACSNCTRLLVNQEELWEMDLDNFRLACKSLADYTGTIAIIGGNPTMHSKFEDICKIFREEIPNKKQRGLWSNNVFKHEAVCLETFGGFNLNAHDVPRGIKSLRSLYKKNGKKGNLYDGASHHSPLLTAGKDLFDPETMWKKIADCDINKYWSGTIIQNQGKLRAYFCEVAASFDLAKKQDHGMEVLPGWWKRPMADFSTQVKALCPSCGVPAKLKGHMDYEETDTYTISNIDLVNVSKKYKRHAILVDKEYAKQTINHDVTEYTKSHLLRKKIIGRIKHHVRRFFL